MNKSNIKKWLKLLKTLNRNRGDDSFLVSKTAMLGLMFGATWVDAVAAGQITPEQLIAQLGASLSAAEENLLLADIKSILANQAAGQSISIDVFDQLAEKLLPLASEAGLTQDQLLALLKDVGFSEVQLARLKPELEEVIVEKRLNTPDPVKTVEATTAGDALGGTAAVGEGVLPVAGIGAGGGLIAGTGAIGLAAAAGGGGGGASVGSVSTPPFSPPPLNPTPVNPPVQVVTLNKTVTVIDGPLQGARVFYDANLDGQAQSTEFLGLTDQNGAVQVQYTPVAGAKFIIISDENTKDVLTGNKFSTLLMADDNGLEGEQVASPLSTLLSSGAISEAMLKQALGLDASIDLSTFNFINALKGGASSQAELAAAQKLSAAAVAFGNIIESSINAAKALNPGLNGGDINALTMKAFQSAAKALNKVEPGASLSDITGAAAKFAAASVLDPSFNVDEALASVDGPLTATSVVNLPASLNGLVNNISAGVAKTSASLQELFGNVSDLNSFNAVVGTGGALDNLEDLSEDIANTEVNGFLGLNLNKDAALVLEGQSEVVKGNLLMNDTGLPVGVGLFTVNGTAVPANLTGSAADPNAVGNSYVLSTFGYSFDGSNQSLAKMGSFVGLDASSLSKAGASGTAGSALKQTITVKAGDTLTFDYQFGSYDYLPYNDFAFLSIKGANGATALDGATKLVNITDLKGSKLYAEAGVFKTLSAKLSYTFQQEGTFIVGVGVSDAIDQIFDSLLTVQNFRLNGDPIQTVASTVGNVQTNASAPVTEVSALVVLGDFGTLVVSKNGDYAYIPGGNHVTDDLVAGQKATDEFTYTVQLPDGKLASQKLSVEVLGTGEGVDLAPLANDDLNDAAAGSAVIEGSVAINDFDLTPGAGGLLFSLNSPVPGLTLNADGTYLFNPNDPAYAFLALNQSQIVVATYTVTDGAGQFDTAELKIVLAGANDAPVAVDDVVSATEGVASLLMGNLASNDFDADQGAVLTYSLLNPVPGLVVSPNGTYSFNPSVSAYNGLVAGQLQVIVATIQVSDEQGAIGNSTLSISLTGTNDAPVAVADAVLVDENLNSLAGSVALNDSDPDAGETALLTYALNSAVPGLSMNSDGTYVLNLAQPVYNSLAQGQTLEVNATYTVTDPQGATAVGSLIITVAGQNDLPVVVNDSNSVSEGTGLVTGTLAANDSDPDQGAVLTYSLSAPVAGLTVNPDGTYVFNTNAPQYNGLAQGQVLQVFAFINIVDEQGASPVAAVTGVAPNSPVGNSVLSITITGTNDAPVAVADVFETNEDGGVLTGSVAINDSDPDAGELESLSYALNAPVPGLTLNPDGSFTLDLSLSQYQGLQAGQTLNIVASYSVKDPAGATSSSSLTISVFGINDAPIATEDAASVSEGTDVLLGSLKTNDSDPDVGDQLQYSVGEPLSGLTVKQNGEFEFNPSHPAYDTLAQGDVLVLVVPYTVIDSSGATANATLTLTLTGTNDAPVAVADTNVAAEGLAAIVGTVANNDFDVDAGSVLTFALLNPVAGLVFNADGSYLFDPNHPVYDSIQGNLEVVAPYEVTDQFGASSTSTLIIQVLAGNDAPVALPDSNAGVEGVGLVEGSLALNDSDPDGDELSYSLLSGFDGLTVSEDGNYVFDPSHPSYEGLSSGQLLTLEAVYQVQDEGGVIATSTLSIKLKGTNDIPTATVAMVVANEDDGLVSGSLTDFVSDPDVGDVLSFTLQTPVDGLSLLPNGDYEFNTSAPVYQALAAGQTAQIVVSYLVQDSLGASSVGQLLISVTGTNDLPVAKMDGNSVSVINRVVSGSVAFNDSDVDQGSLLTYTAAQPYPGLVMAEDGSYEFDLENAELEFDENGLPLPFIFEYVVTDEQGASAVSTLTISVVLEENSAPLVENDELAVLEGDEIFFGNLSGNDSDPDAGDQLSYSLLNQVTGLTVFSTGQYQFDPSGPLFNSLAQGELLQLEAIIGVTDSLGAMSVSKLFIQVTGTNDSPLVSFDFNTAVESVSIVTGDLSLNDGDPDDGAVLTYSLPNLAPAGFVLNPNGTYAFDATVDAYEFLADGQVLNLVINYQVTDQLGASNVSQLQLTLLGTNDAPVAFADSGSLVASPFVNVTLTGNLITNDIDVDSGDVLSVVQINGQSTGFKGTNDFVLSTNSAVQMPGSSSSVFGQDAVSQSQMEIVLNLTAGQLDMVTGTATNGQSAVNATSGSLLYKQITVQAGEQLVFDYSFGSIDYLPFNDFGFVSIEGAGVFKLKNVEDIKGPLSGTLGGVFVQSLKETFSFVFTEAGTYTIGLGVLNVGDSAVDSKLIIDNLNVAGPFEQLGIIQLNVGIGSGLQAAFVEGEYGFLTVFPDGNYTYTLTDKSLAQGELAQELFNYTMADQLGASSFSKLTISLEGTNDAPIALPDFATLVEGTGVFIGSVATNDIDTDNGAILTFKAISSLAGFTLAPDGTYSLDTNSSEFDHLQEGQSQTFSFVYEVMDEFGATHISSLNITVQGTNDLPVAVVDTNLVTDQPDVVASVSGNLLSNDTDPEVFSSFGLKVTAVGGKAVVSSQPANEYLLSTNYSPYGVVFNSPVSQSQIETTIGLEPLSLDKVAGTSFLSNPNAGINATVGSVIYKTIEVNAGDVFSFDFAFGSVDYLPFNDFAFVAIENIGVMKLSNVTAIKGPLFFNKAYQYVEGPLQQFSYEFLQAGTFTVAIGVMNALDGIVDSKLILKNFNVETDFATLGIVDITGTEGNLGADAFVTLEGQYGVLTVYENGNYLYTLTDDTLPLGFQGQESFSYSISDPDGGASVSSLVIDVVGGNDTPVAVSDENAASEGTALVFGSVAVNDRDVDEGAELVYTLSTAVTGLALNEDGSYTFDPADPAYNYLPQGQVLELFANYEVTDEFGAKSFAQLKITLTGTNDAPVAVAEQVDVVELPFNDPSFVFGNVFSSGAVDADLNDAVKVIGVDSQTLSTLPAPKGYVISTNYGQAGSTQFASLQGSLESVLGLTSGELDLVAGTSASNDGPPVDATSGSVIYKTILVSAGDQLTFTYQFGSVDYLPYNDFGFVSISGIGVTKLSSVKDVKGPVFFNQAGEFIEGAEQQFSYTFEQAGTYIVGVGVLNAFDSAVDSKLKVSALAINNIVIDELFESGVVEALFLDVLPQAQAIVQGLYGVLKIFEDGSYQYALTDQSLSVGQTAQEVFDYIISDSQGATSASTLTINVTGTNDAPVAVQDFNAATEGTDAVFGNVGVNDRDVDSDASLLYEVISGVSGFSLETDGSYVFDPTHPDYDYLKAGESLTLFVQYVVTDQHGANAIGTLAITLTGTNDAPVAFAELVDGISEDAGTYVGNLLFSVQDADHLTSELTFSHDSEVMGFTLNADGSYVLDLSLYQYLAQGEILDLVVNYTVMDPDGGVAQSTLTLRVLGASDGFVLEQDSAAVIEDTQPIVLGNLLANDVLAPGAKIKIGDLVLEPASTNQLILSTGSDLPNDVEEGGINDALASQFLKSIAELEILAGLQPGELNSLTNASGAANSPGSTPFEGSAIFRTLNGLAGQTLSFDFQLVSAEVDVNDFAYVTIVGPNGFKLVQVLDQSANLPNFGTGVGSDPVLNYERGAQQSFSFTFAEDGEYTISIGVVDTHDQFVPTQLLINNLSGAAQFTAVGAFAINAVAIDELAQIKGQFGVLYVQPNGGYLYVLANDFAQVNALNDGDTLTDVFVYEVVLPDGTVNSSTLSVLINGKTDIQFQITEQIAADLIGDGFIYPDADNVTLFVDGTTLSDKGLTLGNLAKLGVDVIVGSNAGTGDINIELGTVEIGQELFPMFETDGQVTVGFGLESEGTTLAGSKTALAGLASLGVDSIALADGGNFVLGEAGAATLLEVGLTFAENFTTADEQGNEQTVATNAVLFADGTTLSDKGLSLVALQALGVDSVIASDLANAQLSVELGAGFSLADVQEDGVQFFSNSDVTLGLSAAATEFGNSGKLSALASLGVDGLALTNGGILGISVAEALNVQSADLVFENDFVSAIDGQEITTLTSVVLNADGTSLADTPLTLKALAALGVDVLQGEAGQKLTADIGALSVTEFEGLDSIEFAEQLQANALVDDDFVASFSSKQAAAEFFESINADTTSIKVGDTDASLSKILENLENLNATDTAFASLSGQALVDAFEASGISELVYDTNNPIIEAQGGTSLQALADAGLLRASTDKSLSELGDLAEQDAAAQVDTLGLEGVRLVIKSGVQFTGEEQSDAQAIDELLAKFDDDDSGAVEAGEALFAQAAKVTLSVDTSDLSLTGDQLQDLINLGVDSLVNRDGTTVEILGKTGDQTDIFGNNS